MLRYPRYILNPIISQKNKMRLFEFGFFKGQKIKLIKKSFLKKTLLIELMNNILSIRSEIAMYVMVTI